MVSVNLIDPFVYAISSGDNFDEIQIIDELEQEDDNFDDEEKIDIEEENNEILDEDQDNKEDTDIDENEDDETNENSELNEDDNIGEKTDENEEEKIDNEENNNEVSDEKQEDEKDVDQDEESENNDDNKEKTEEINENQDKDSNKEEWNDKTSNEISDEEQESTEDISDIKENFLKWFGKEENILETLEEQSFTVTFDANRWAYEDKPADQTVNNGSTVTEPTLHPDFRLPWYNFVGWYTEAKGGRAWDFANDIVTDDMTLYAHWDYALEFGELDAYLIGSDGAISKYVMMDRNLWASALYDKNYTNPLFDSLGYTYQWWNNRWFERCSGNGTTCFWSGKPNPYTNTTKVDKTPWWGDYMPSNFTRKYFVETSGNPRTWTNNGSNSDNLWWNTSSATDFEARQWPCPEWYYVPSSDNIGGSDGLVKKWGNSYWIDVTANGKFWSYEQEIFTSQFLWPLAWHHNKWVKTDSDKWVCADYWTSTSKWKESAVNTRFCKNGWNGTYGNPGYFRYDNVWQRSSAISVRCFKNSKDSANLTINPDGWNGAVIIVDKLNGTNTIIALTNPSKKQGELSLVFSWWYTSPTFEANTRKEEKDLANPQADPTVYTLSANETGLYAKWDCPTDYQFIGTSCVKSPTITFDANGGTIDVWGVTQATTTEVLLYGATYNYDDLPTPTRPWYIFKGWYLNFDWVDDYVDYGRAYMFTDQISFHASAYMDTWDTGKRIVSSTHGGWWAMNGWKNWLVKVTAYKGNASSDEILAESSTKWVDLPSKWHDFDFVFDGNQLKLYLDWNLIAESTSGLFPNWKIVYNPNNTMLVGAEVWPSTIPENPGYYFEWMIKNVIFEHSNQRITPTNALSVPNQDVTYYALWEESTWTYNVQVTVDPVAWWSVTWTGEYNEGDTITLSATPNSLYYFTWWYDDSDNLISNDNPYIFIADSSEWTWLKAVFELIHDYEVSATSNDENKWTVSVTEWPYTYGKRLELIATPNIWYILERWQLNGKYVMTWDNQYWTWNLVIDQLTWDVVVTGHFVPKDGIQYLIKYRKENIYDSWYDDIYTEVFTWYWRTDSEIVVEEMTYPWFILSGNISDYQWVKIAWDGSTVVNVYYKRRSYTINFDSNWWSYVTWITARYWIHLDKPEDPKKDGYIFSWWIPSFPSEMPLNWADLVADWIDNRTVDYTIKYWKENLDDSWYTEIVSDEKSMTWKVNTDAEIVLRPYLWFVLSWDVSDYQTKIAWDGSTVINLYYNRIKYTVSAWSSDENKWTVIYTWSWSEKYEKMVLFTKQEKPWFKFEKWMLNGQVITWENNEYWTWNLKVKVIDNINVIGYFIPEIYTVTVVLNNTDFWTVSPEILTGYYLANISIVDNVFTVSGSSSIATHKQNTEEYTYTFSGWTNNCGNTLSWNCTVIANFDRTKNSYDITFVSNSWSTVDPQRKEYWEKVDKPADPIRTGYGFSGWFYTWLETEFDFEDEIVTWDIILYAKWTPIVYNINYNLNWWVLSWWVSNPLSYTIESWDIILNNPERVWYNFIWWTGTDIQWYSWTVKILSWSIWNREYTANWEARNDIDVTINYYFQDLNKDENKLITGSYSLSGTTKIQGTSDDEIILSNYSWSFDWYTYEYWKVLWEIVTTTTVSPDWSRIIDLYYTRNTYQFTLITDEGSITEWTSPIWDYYYWAKIILSWDKDGDCFVWDEWKTQWIILENNMNHTSFDMPANNVFVESLVIEKTYNIIFDWNWETSWEMEMISWVRCTQPVTLTLNTFVKSGHTFTWWSEIPDGEKKYEDGKTVITLTTWSNITLYAKWDINYYLVTWNNYNWELLDKQLLPYWTIPEYIWSISPSRESDAQYSYGFSWWIPGYTKVEGPQVYTADYSTTLNEYTIIWNVDWVETSEVYKYGDNPKFSWSVHKDPTAQYTYTFSWWNPSISVVTTWEKYTATYKQKLREYKVTWVNYNWDVLEIDENVQYWIMPSYNWDTPVRTGDTQQTYTFIWWEPTLTWVVKDTTYEAVFSWNLNTFTIIWENYDGEPLETDLDVPYWTMPSYDWDTPTKPSDAEYDYEFTWWSPATWTVVSNQIYKAKYTPKLRTYTVRWLNSDKTEIEKDENVQYWTMPSYDWETPTSWWNAQYSYRFIWWNPATWAVVWDVDYEAIYEPVLNTYTVLWKDRDGTILNTGENMPYWTTPIYGGDYPTRTWDAQFSYEFTWWSPNVWRIEWNTTYTAQYKATVNKYVITWKDWDGNTLKTEQIEYGKLPVYSWAEPTKTKTKQYTYIFSGSWTPAIETVKWDTTYTAEFNSIVNKYKVTWKNYNWDVLKEDNNISYWETPVYSWVEPTKPWTAQHSYEFIWWEPDVWPIEGDTIYVAQFVAVSESYTVIWKNRDNEELERDENVPYWTMPSYNWDTPERASDTQYTYSFSWWNPDISEVTSDITYVATFKTEVNKYTITWENEDWTVLKTDYNVPYWTMPVYSWAVPVKTWNAQFSYEFTWWSPSVKVVQWNAVYRARYDEIINKYTVTWMDRDGTELETDPEVEYWTTPVYHWETPTKEGDIQYSYEFGWWDKEILEIHGDTTYTAIYTQSVNEYEITWKDWDGNTLKTENVPYWETPVYSWAEPTKARTQQYTYTFSGSWTPAIETVEWDATYTAEFNSIVNKYTINIEANANSWSVSSGLVMIDYGTSIITSGNELKIWDTLVTATPNWRTPQYTYTFSGWNNTCGLTLTWDCTIEAEFISTINKYTITWFNSNWIELEKDENVPYWTLPSYDWEIPISWWNAQYSYTFAWWNPTTWMVTWDTTYTAIYTQSVNKYTITWFNSNWAELEKDENVPYWTMPTYDKGIPTSWWNAQYSYIFAWWDPATWMVIWNAEYTATYTQLVNKYKVKFVNDDGNILKDLVEYDYGTLWDNIEKPDEPTKPRTAQYTYTFAWWTPNIEKIIRDVTFKATYTTTVNKYTVIWENEDWTVLETGENISYWTMPVYHWETPLKPGDGSWSYIFAWWDPTPTIVKGDITYIAKYKNKTVPDDGSSWKRRSGSWRRRHTSEETDQHGAAETWDVVDVDKEVFDAYKWAYKYWITTMDTEETANPDWYVVRWHLAKMVVNFSVNVLWRDMPLDTPTKCKRKDKSSEWESSEIKFYAEKSCAMWLMWIYTEEFMPNKIVDRAEFWTVVSRILWWEKYNELDTDNNLYFTKHLKALQENGFMKDIDNPLWRRELRKRVWVTLKRIELEKEK